jgi:hypothetical protein
MLDISGTEYGHTNPSIEWACFLIEHEWHGPLELRHE